MSAERLKIVLVIMDLMWDSLVEAVEFPIRRQPVSFIVIKLFFIHNQTMHFIFYKLSALEKRFNIPLENGYKVTIHYPTLRKFNLHSHLTPIYLFWYIFTFGRYCIFYVYDENEKIIHFSHVMPKIFKYAYMPRKNSVHIGPCWTDKNHRGKGIYPAVLSRICTDYNQKNVYISTTNINRSSQKGIEKVVFKRFATGFKTKLLGIYKIR